MTIPKIELIIGSRNSENIVLTCTGCNEHYSYSVRQYKGDFGCNITEFKSFLDWAKGDAAKHECFLAGRVGYIEEPPTAYHVDFPQVEHRGNPFGRPGYVMEPMEEKPCPTCGALPICFVDGDCPACNPPIERHEDPFSEEAMSGGYWPEEFDDEDDPYEDDWVDLGIDVEDDEDEEPFSDNYDWDEVRFDFLYGEYEEPDLVIDDEEMDKLRLEAGIYTRDARGNLRDEKGRCLACLRHGVHR